MDSPQLENGYTKIANEILEALSKYRIPGEQMQCLFFIIRKTYGWGKKEDEIPLSDFVEGTGINKQAVSRALKSLKDKNVITVIKKDNRINTTYGINKKYKTWKPLSKKITLSKKIMTVIKKDNGALSKKIIPPIYKKNSKETIKNKAEAEKVLGILNKLSGKNFRVNDTNLKNIKARLDENFTIDDCEKVLQLKLKDQYFIENPKYYNPETLFRPKNFEKYLNEKPKNNQSPTGTKYANIKTRVVNVD